MLANLRRASAPLTISALAMLGLLAFAILIFGMGALVLELARRYRAAR